MVICSEPVSDRVRLRGSPLAFVAIKLFFPSLLFAAAGRDEEEEGDAHRPGDHELRESVSIFHHSWIRSCTEGAQISTMTRALVFFLTDLWMS